jgi:Flp pilus assembly protein TadB
MSWLGRDPRKWAVSAAVWVFFGVTAALAVSPWWALVFVLLAVAEVLVWYVIGRRDPRSTR